jgi:hypothetical protein
MKKSFGFWLSIGMGTGVSIGIAMKEIPGGITFGIITGFLLALVQTSSPKNKIQ